MTGWYMHSNMLHHSPVCLKYVYFFSSHSAVFRFAHAETLLPLLALLGLFKDEQPIKGTDYLLNQNRAFKTNTISPFSANIAFVLLACDVHDDDLEEDLEEVQNLILPSKWERYMVQVLFKELPVKLPLCESHFCSFTQLKNKLVQFIDHCDFEGMCSVHDEL